MSFSRGCAMSLCLLLLPIPIRAQEPDADALLTQALRLADLYNWSDAAPLFTDAERVFTERGDASNALYAKLGRIRSTMEQLSLPEASAMLEAELENNPLLKTDKRLRLFCLTVKGDIDGELDAGPARRDWEAARDLALELNDSKWQNRSAGELGYVAFLEGDLAKAQQLIATALIGATAAKDFGAQMRYLASIGTGLAWTGLADQALTYFDRADSVAAQARDSGYQFLIVEGRVIALRELGRLDEAESLANEMIGQARARNKRVKEAQGLISAAGISIKKKEYPRGITRLQQAIALATEGKFVRLLADAQFELAALYRNTGDLKKAEELASSAVGASQTGGEIYELPERLHYLAQLQVSLGKYSDADVTYTQASDLVDTMVGNVSRVAAKVALITASSEIFTEHFALIAEHLNKVSNAYEVLERARGRATTDLIRTAQGPNEHDVEVDKQISRLRLDLIDAKSAADVRRIRDDVFLAEQRRWVGPTPNRLASRSRETIALDELRHAIGSDELLIEYVLSDPASYCLVIAKNSERIAPLPGRGEIDKVVAPYLKALRSKESSTALGKQLFEMLLKPLTEVTQKTRLIVIPDGQLHLVPFDALINNAGRYLITTHVISYSPSASTWYLLKTMPSQVAERSFLGVGGVPYDENLGKVAMTRGYSPDALGNLPGSKDEIVAASDAIRSKGNTLLIGAAATEAAFKNARLTERSIIHLAVHGIENQQRPDQAALLLLSDPGQGEDGILQASEIVQLRTSADVIVLSACDTALGRLQGAEGIANLARAFLLSGARSVVATLWAIDDTWSLSLMKEFYKNLVAGKSVTDALTAAKREIIRLYGLKAVPYYWAGFTLEGVGDTSVIAKPIRRGN
jgi:CHAT domain-containing protein